MTGNKLNMISRFIGAMFCIASISIALPSCEKLYEDLDPCPHGVSLRFIYDHNMEWANAFPKQVDCLTLYIYDEDGDYVDTKVVTGAELQDESYRMTLDLEKGVYRFVAYGGMACEKASFSWAGIPSQGSRYTDLVTKMDISQVNSPIAEQRRLHDMFWGELTLATADLYSEGTVEMMKNTNNLRIVLQQENGKPVDVNDFDFAITDNNSVFGHDNDLITENVSPVTYRPWSTGQAQTGVSIVGDKVVPEAVVVAYAELSISRLMLKNEPNLLITRKSDGKVIVDFPLITYLTLLCSDNYRKPPYNLTDNQEYLDRESNYAMVFFLQPDHSWLDTRIVVNNWIVRINNAEL